MPTTAVILAAGKGTRMRSPLPKVLHTLAGRPLLHHVLECARAVRCKPIITVVGHGADLVRRSVDGRFGKGASGFALQAEQRGTGHAVKVALPKLRGVTGDVLILSGDVPLLRPDTVKALLAARRRSRAALAVGTVVLAEAGAYGRVVRGDDGRVLRVVEAKDATPEERAIGEINTGLYAVEVKFLRDNLKKLRSKNAQGEYYLTDLVELAAAGRGAEAVVFGDEMEVAGVNTLADLAACERTYQAARKQTMMLEGTRILAPETLFLDADVEVAPGAFLGASVQLLGRTKVGAGARIEGGAVLKDSSVGAGAFVGANAVLEGASVAAGARVGALTYLGDAGAEARRPSAV